jgi:hypothetical protein
VGQLGQDQLAPHELRGQDLGTNLENTLGVPVGDLPKIAFYLGWNNTEGTPINSSGIIYDLDLFVIPPNSTVGLCQPGGEVAIGKFEKVTCQTSLPGAQFIVVDSGIGPQTEVSPFVGNGFRIEAVTFEGDYPIGQYRVGVFVKDAYDLATGAPPPTTQSEVTYGITAAKKLPDGQVLGMDLGIINFVIPQLPVIHHDVFVPAEGPPTSPDQGNQANKLPPEDGGPPGIDLPLFFDPPPPGALLPPGTGQSPGTTQSP